MEFEIQIQLALSFQGHNDMAIFQNDFFIFFFVVPIVLFDETPSTFSFNQYASYHLYGGDKY